MRRSRAALTLFLAALAAALQTAGLADVQQGLATEGAAARPADCFRNAPLPTVRTVAFAEDWYLDACHPDYDCYGSYGADCYNGPIARPHEPALLDAQPIDEYQYGYEWDCGSCGDECEASLASPRIHLEDLSALAADPRHSTGQEDVLRLNRENEGLQAASLSSGDHPRDLPAGETFYVARLSTGRVASTFDDDDLYHTSADYSDGEWYCDDYAGCQPDEPEDLPPGETVLHAARPSTPAYDDDYTYDGYDYDYDYDYDYAQYGDTESYAYDEYAQPYAASAARAAEPAFTSVSGVEPDDLPAGEHYSGDLPPGEVLTDDLPPSEDLYDDLPPGELIDDLPPAEPVTQDLPETELGECNLPAHELVASDLPPAEDISDLPAAEAGDLAPEYLSRDAYRNDYEYEYDYGYQCDCDYDVESYGDYRARTASHATADYTTAAANVESLRPVLRTASWLLGRMGEALLGLSRSCEEMAAENEPVKEVQLPAELDYPWPTILGRKPNRDASPGL